MRLAFDENFGDERIVAAVSLIRLVSEMLFFLLLEDFLIYVYFNDRKVSIFEDSYINSQLLKGKIEDYIFQHWGF